MRKICKKNPVSLIHKDGHKTTFYSYSMLINFIAVSYWIKNEVGTHYTDLKDYFGGYTYIVRDSFETIFLRKNLLKDVEACKVKPKHVSEQVTWWYRMKFPVKYQLRYDPVPFIRRHKKVHHLKHPHTTQEKREWDKTLNLIEEAECFIKLRQRRSSKHLPNLYDDVPREYINKSWKHYRKTQYK